MFLLFSLRHQQHDDNCFFAYYVYVHKCLLVCLRSDLRKAKVKNDFKAEKPQEREKFLDIKGRCDETDIRGAIMNRLDERQLHKILIICEKKFWEPIVD